MVPQKIKNLTLEHGLLWNTIIFKSEPPYCAFTHWGLVTDVWIKSIVAFMIIEDLESYPFHLHPSHNSEW
jgi:hypothetical protein